MGWANLWLAIGFLASFIGVPLLLLYLLDPVICALGPLVPRGVLFFGVFIVVQLGPVALLWLALYSIDRRIRRKRGLLCPKCGTDLTNNYFAITRCGICSECGELVIEDAPFVRRGQPTNQGMAS